MGWISWLCPGINLKRWLLLFAGGVLCCAIGLALFFNYQFMGFVEEMLFVCHILLLVNILIPSRC